MAQYTRELLAPVLARLESQAEELGALRERLAVATARIAELEAPADPDSPSPAPSPQASGAQNGADPHEGERRRWWARLWAWAG
jgi:hypothetical protein